MEKSRSSLTIIRNADLIGQDEHSIIRTRVFDNQLLAAHNQGETYVSVAPSRLWKPWLVSSLMIIEERLTTAFFMPKEKTLKKKLFSGIQPTGNLTIGNYAGAIKNWVKLQEIHDCIFCLVDLHAMTDRQNSQKFKEKCLDFIAMYIACGIDPEKSIVFAQSHVSEHAELTWVLNCFTYMGELSRMTQFKEKLMRQNNKNINVGLFDYPVLMAADILLYGTHTVPVGDDQKQHVELARDIAVRFNSVYGNIFEIPEAFIPDNGARIKNLLDPKRKMDKSNENPKTYIALADSPDSISDKIKGAVTDPSGEYKIGQDSGISNLITIMSAISDSSEIEIAKLYEGQGYSRFKKDLAEKLIDFLYPIQKRYHELRSDESILLNIIHHGAEKARRLASKTMRKVNDKIGLIPNK